MSLTRYLANGSQLRSTEHADAETSRRALTESHGDCGLAIGCGLVQVNRMTFGDLREEFGLFISKTDM